MPVIVLDPGDLLEPAAGPALDTVDATELVETLLDSLRGELSSAAAAAANVYMPH